MSSQCPATHRLFAASHRAVVCQEALKLQCGRKPKSHVVLGLLAVCRVTKRTEMGGGEIDRYVRGNFLSY